LTLNYFLLLLGDQVPLGQFLPFWAKKNSMIVTFAIKTTLNGLFFTFFLALTTLAAKSNNIN